MFRFEELRVYQEGLNFVDFVYETTNAWPKDERYGLMDQARRAATSIVLNIAEGCSRSGKDFRHFLDLSRGSCYESAAISMIAKRRKYIGESDHRKLYVHVETIAKMISALKTSIK